MREIWRQHLLGADWADFWRMSLPPERLEHPDGVCVRSCSDRTCSDRTWSDRTWSEGIRSQSAPSAITTVGAGCGVVLPVSICLRAASSVGVNELPFWNSLGSRRQCVRYGGNICWARIVLIFCGCHSPRARTSSSRWVSVFVRRPIVLGLRASAPHPPDPRSQVLGPDAADRL